MFCHRFCQFFWCLALSTLAITPGVSQAQQPLFQSLLTSVNTVRGTGSDDGPPVTGSAFSCGSGGAAQTADSEPGSYTLFESGPVRPLALSPNGRRLAVANSPANCLEIYQLNNDQMTLESSVMVGLEPVAVAFSGNDEVWVVNHLSDSVSVVALEGVPRVVDTILVGDEPRDIVFAGDEPQRAFVTAAFRGQNHPSFSVDDLLTPGLGRADVWVLASGVAPGADRLVTIINMFSDSPRALAVSPDGDTVYAAAFMSGNQTTSLSAGVVEGAKPLPEENHQGELAPETGLIVRKDNNRWLDGDGTDWTANVMLDLPDYDVFLIDASSEIPNLFATVSGVGTTLFNMAVNPVSGTVYVSGLEALNDIRFEGPGEQSTTVRGQIALSGIAVVDASGAGVTRTHLNPHVDFDVPEKTAYGDDVTSRSLSQPTGMVVDASGDTLYVAALGSGKVAKIPTAELQQGGYTPRAENHIDVPGGGPVGLVLLDSGDRLVVYSRFSHSLALIDTGSGDVMAEAAMFTPEPANIIAGRRFLYDARETSANGTSACSSCHIFGDMDQLAWDLGNPDGDLLANANPYIPNSPRTTLFFHPMKGPMTTQTLRGIADSGPQHWRGDRMGRNRVEVRGELESVAAAAFKEFNPAFVELVGRTEEIAPEDMQAFTDFAMALTPPPNPVRNLDNSLTERQANGLDIYFNVDDITGLGSCNHCHTLNPEAKQFGTSGLMTFEGAGVAENFKVPHFRNAYAKVGMFGTSGRLNQGSHAGDQIKGFGYLHDGSVASLADFFASPTFGFPEPRRETEADIVRFVMAADSNLAPIVGQQITVSAASSGAALERLTLLETRAQLGGGSSDCDLIVRGVLDDQRFSALLTQEGNYLDTGNARHEPGELLTAARTGSNVLTYTCTPPGSGRRLALDEL